MEVSTVSKLSSLGLLLALLSHFSGISTVKTCSAARLDLQQKTNTEFIKNSCWVTMYPQVCYKSLSSYASTVQTSPRRLAQAALSVSLTSAQSTSSKMVSLSQGNGLKPREAAALKDCVDTIRDAIDELQQSLGEMKHLGGPDFELKMSNIQTWVSAALTNEDTCMDSFEGNAMNGKIKNTVRSNIVSVAQLTSNALALINKLSST